MLNPIITTDQISGLNPYRKRIISHNKTIDNATKVDEASPVEEIAAEGEAEALKETIKESVQNSEKLEKLLDNSTTVVFKASTVWPFVLFPHEIIITLGDVSVVFGKFITSREIRTVSISKIAEVIVSTGFLFAKLRIIDIEYSQLSLELEFLSIKEAMKAKRLIQGLLFASKEGIDLTKIEDEHLIEKIEELGRVQGERLDQKT